MLQNKPDKTRGFFLSSSAAHLSFTLSNSLEENNVDYHYSGVKFELPAKSSTGAQPGNLSRIFSSSTLIKSYSCLACDVFVAIMSMSASLTRPGSGISDAASADAKQSDSAAVLSLLEKASKSYHPKPLYLDDEGCVHEEIAAAEIVVVSRATLFSNAKPSGVPPPSTISS